MTPRATLVRSLLVAALVALSTACGSQGTRMDFVPATVAAGPTVPVAGHCSMTTLNALVPVGGPARAPAGVSRGGSLPPDFTPVRVFSCATEERDVPGDGLWRVAEERSAPAGAIADLVAAYRTTTAAVMSGPDSACALVADEDPPIAFVDAHGTAIWPAPPRDPKCSHIVPTVTAAIHAVPWTVTATERIVHDRTAGGCVRGFKDMLDLTPPGPAAPGPYFAQTPGRVAICVYQKSAGGDGAGTLVHERVLRGTGLAEALAVLDAAPPARDCMASSTRFAVLYADGEQRESYLELDGCRRVGRIATGGAGDHAGVRQLDAAGLAALVGSGA